MSFNFAARMQNLWRDRFLQRNQEVRQGLRELREELENSTSVQDIDLSVLEASLLRSSGEIERSNQTLKDLQSRSDNLPSAFYVQRGINLFVEGEYALALEYFVRAQKRSQSDFEDLTASSNILLCLENLNFDTSEKLKDVQKTLKRLKDPELTAALEQHLMGFAQRQSFRWGQIAKIYKNNDDTNLNQAFFYRQWVAQLPYVQTAKKYDQSRLAALFSEQNLHLKNFRMKTLLADSRLVDEEKVELREYTDRLYLWTWRWLTSNEEYHRENLKECLHDFSFHSFHKNMTGEDILMLKNSFRWILLFQSESAKFLEPVLNVLSTLKVQSTPIFEIEEMLICYLGHVKKNETAKAHALAKKIRAHELYKQPGLSFAKWMKHFSKKLQDQKGSNQATSINLSTSQFMHNGKEIVSEPLVNLLLALLEQDSLPFSEALEVAFNVPGYDEDVHKVKIHNLLSRLRDNLPEDLKIFTRQGRIYLQGNKEAVTVVPRSSLALPLLDRPLLHEEKPLAEVKKASLDRWVHPQLVLRKAAGKKRFTRQDLEKLTQTSKATTNRWIQKWLDEGLLKKTGQGKSTQYLVEMS